MSRKEDNKSKSKDAIVTVNIDDFTATRDRVIVSLAHLQSAVSDLSRAYINHANTVLNRGPISIESNMATGLAGGLAGSLTSSLLENGLLGAGVGHHPSQPDVAAVQPAEKKKRKRAPHDPNAPKRALTPYFLFMKVNREQIRKELGPDAKPKEVADEGTRRWANLPDTEKEVWKKVYASNLEKYKNKVKLYKAGLPIPKDSDDEVDIAADDQLQQSVAAAEAKAAEVDDEEEEEDEDENDESSPEPAKEPTPPPSGKRRRTGGKPAAASSPVVTKKVASPEKKKTPAAKAKKDDKEPASGRKSIGASTDGKRNKKKRKSEVGDEE